MLQRSVASLFIILATCPFTAPFAACDLGQAVSGHMVTAAPAAGGSLIARRLSSSPTVDDAGVQDEQIKDDDDLLNVVVVKSVVFEFRRPPLAGVTPWIGHDRVERPPLLALRL